MLGAVICEHAEDRDLTAGGAMHEGALATRLGLPGMPSVAEVIATLRALLLAQYTGARVHICHVSTAGTVQWVRWAKERGIRVTAEVTPHHLLLTDETCVSFDTSTKVNPPLREEADRQACLEALTDGTIDVIATDHAPHPFEDKTTHFDLHCSARDVRIGIDHFCPR